MFAIIWRELQKTAQNIFFSSYVILGSCLAACSSFCLSLGYMSVSLTGLLQAWKICMSVACLLACLFDCFLYLLAVNIAVHLASCLPACLPVCLPVRLSFCLFVCLYVCHLTAFLPVCPPLWLPVFLLVICQFVCLTIPSTVIRFVWVSAIVGTCTVVSVNGTPVEAKMFAFTFESADFVFSKCSI